MPDSLLETRQAQQSRTRAMVMPREHGAWGLLLVPLFTGVVAGAISVERIWPMLLFTLAVLALFWLRTPVESLLGTAPLSARTTSERRAAVLASTFLAGLSAACLARLMWDGARPKLLLLGAIGALLFVAQTLLKRLGRVMRMPAQLVGAMGLTCTAPAAYYTATGRLGMHALSLWAANWIFAGNQIHFVHVRIQAVRAATFKEKFQRGWLFFAGQLFLLPVVAATSYGHVMPPWAVVAFVPAVFRGIYWFSRGPSTLQIKSLGWSEMKQGILFGVLLATAFVLWR